MADTYKTISCPACGKTMKKIFIPSAGISVDICADSCGGIFFDNQELQKFNHASSDASLIQKELEGKNFIKVDESETRICPACNKPMVKTNIKGIGVQIDTCYNCGAVFLDNGELDAIRNGVRTTSIESVKKQNNVLDDSAVKQFYKEAQKENVQRDALLNTCNVLFGSRGRGRFGRRRYGLVDLLWDMFSSI